MSISHPRPLSPHLGIYRWQISNTLSILHRMTGIALMPGTLLLVYWLWAAAYSPECFAALMDFFWGTHNTIYGYIGKALLLGWSFALFYHLCNGIRHLFWDAGLGFEKSTMNTSGIVTVLVSLSLTAGSWWYFFCHSMKAAG